MRQKLYLIVFAVIAIIIIGCKGKDSRNLSEIPETMVCTHADSIALAVNMLTGHGSHCLYLLPFLPQDSEHNDSRI